MNISFSVIIPLYNKEEYIHRTIDSVLSQSYENFEIVVVDDGSNDNSVNIIKSYSDERINLIQQNNAGVSAARNTGILNSRYNYVAFLDADDWWDPNYLEEMGKLIKNYPNVNIYGTQYISVYKDRLMPSYQILDSEKDHDIIDPISLGVKKGKLPLHTSSVIIKKDILKLTGLFDERISYYEDYDLFLRILSFGELAYRRGGLSYYNLNVDPKKKITSKLPSMSRHFISYTEKLNSFFKNDPHIKCFIDHFILDSLSNYHRNNYNKLEISIIKKKVDKSNYTLKDKFILSIPSSIANIVIKAKIRLNEIIKKDF